MMIAMVRYKSVDVGGFGVILYCRSLAPLFDNPKLDKDLCAMLKENFSEFCSTDVRPNSGEWGTFAAAVVYLPD